DRLSQLPADLGLFGIPKVEAVGQSQRLAPGTGDVPGRTEHGFRARDERVELAHRRAVERDRQTSVRRQQTQDGGIQSRASNGARLDKLVVLLVDPRFALAVRGRNCRPSTRGPWFLLDF